MDLFINSGVCKEGWYEVLKISRKQNKNLELCISNYLKKENEYEDIKFIFNTSENLNLKKSLFLENISIAKKGKNNYHISSSKNKKTNTLYALLRSTAIVPDDVFIPANMKDKVKLVKMIQYHDCEVDYGDFLSNTYFIKVNLKKGECLPVFFTSSDPITLKKHCVIYRGMWDGKYYVEDNLETLIILTKEIKSDYISLSQIC